MHFSLILVLVVILHGSRCQESNSVTIDEQAAFEETTQAYVLAVILTQPQTLMVQSGSEIKLPCVVENLKESNGIVAWKKAKSATEDKDVFLTNGRMKVSRNPAIQLEGESLVIKRANEKDGGDYICQVMQDPAVEVRHTLIISRPPTADIQPNEVSKEVPKGDPYDLSCIVNGYPQPVIRWYLKASETQERQELHQFFNHSSIHLENLQRSDAGEYICEADNSVGEAATASHKILLRYQPEVSSDNAAVYLSKVGGEAKLECSFSAYPLGGATVTWYKLDKPPVETTEPPQQTEQAVTEVVTEEQVTAETSVPAEADAESAGQNKRETNGGQGEQVHNGERHSLTENNEGSTMLSSLVIKNVQEDDFRKYVCTANNELGSASHTMELSGLPYPVAVEAAKLAIHEPLKYALAWRVRSSSPIKEYRIIYREYNETHQGHEQNLTVMEDEKEAQTESGDVKLYQKTYVFENLRPFTNYTVQIGVHNDYGWSNERDLQHQFFMSDSTSSPQIGGRSRASTFLLQTSTLASVFLCLLFVNWRREL